MKAWEELTIADNFLFQKVMQNPQLCKRFIEKLLHIKIKKIIYPHSEKTIEMSPTQKGIRLDLYVETDDGVIIDIEMQTTDKSGDFLPKRTRYYQAMIDLNILEKRKDYIELKKSYIIFICTFDPFSDYNRKIYTFSNCCHEQDELQLGDDTIKIFLNTKGIVGELDSDIDKFLSYVDGKAAEGKLTQDIAAEVNRIKQHKETRLEYMTLEMEIKEQRRDAYNEAVMDNICSLMTKKGWSYDEAFDIFDILPKDRVKWKKQIEKRKL
ncbi:MAG: Rpn family recombination-promoting nuclease/putative transposase [Selenomonadaceae bacterium]|nr:Rpn family recombination-promoting nuclease/putative transposase [Selenomonadaceae bacterium]MBP3721778.1 Rpn family recombination-promoting nuclease/putative transposase [Selenomonadaceae bacterium]